MKPNRRKASRTARAAWLASACMALAADAAAAGAASARPVAHDKPRPGLYGRIEVRGAPPPLIFAQPVVARPSDAKRPPVYLYVPPGQVRRWAQHCAKWDACERPVYFVRVDDSPSRLGDWRKTQRPQPAGVRPSAARAQPLHVLTGSSCATCSTSLPKFSPVNRRLSASGNRSMPTTTSSRLFSRPLRR